jgi:hypothetical protein
LNNRFSDLNDGRQEKEAQPIVFAFNPYQQLRFQGFLTFRGLPPLTNSQSLSTIELLGFLLEPIMFVKLKHLNIRFQI